MALGSEERSPEWSPEGRDAAAEKPRMFAQEICQVQVVREAESMGANGASLCIYMYKEDLDVFVFFSNIVYNINHIDNDRSYT